LVKSRLDDPVITRSGKSIKGFSFDSGAWDDHKDFKFSENETVNYRNETQAKPQKTAWDLSHGRRILSMLITMSRNLKVIDNRIDVLYYLKCFSNQFYYVIYNQDKQNPKFTNFLNGKNGWYRVNYNKRKNFGYEPFGLSKAAITGGYLYLVNFNTDISKIANNLYNSLESRSLYHLDFTKPANKKSGQQIKNTLQFMVSLTTPYRQITSQR
jgi:hypothetical protein